MRHGFLGVAIVAVAVMGMVGQARAVDTLAYSFEANIDGFFGLGATVAPSNIGVTNGLTSLEYTAGTDGFIGARTETVIPPTLNNPPGVEYVLVDIFKPAAYAGTFADMGVTVFGHNLNAGTFGHQVQFAGTVSLATLAVGQNNDVKITLGLSQGSYRPGETFNQIFGTDANDLGVASAFQFYMSKNAGVPLTVYLDNVRLGNVPEPATFTLCGLGCVALGLYRRRSRG